MHITFQATLDFPIYYDFKIETKCGDVLTKRKDFGPPEGNKIRDDRRFANKWRVYYCAPEYYQKKWVNEGVMVDGVYYNVQSVTVDDVYKSEETVYWDQFSLLRHFFIEGRVDVSDRTEIIYQNYYRT